MPTNPMTISRFFADVLGAPLRNTRWSWGSVDDSANRVFLRVWDDETDPFDGVDHILVLRPEGGRPSPGFGERERHLARVLEGGATVFGVRCEAVRPVVEGRPRTIKSFDEEVLLRLGPLVRRSDDVYARIDGPIAVSDLTVDTTMDAGIISDLRTIMDAPLSPTTKQALLSARIGQGAFRHHVLQRWGGRCAVTGASTGGVIRASHIKPWADSDNQERLDPENGLPLVADLDALFDCGLISFGADGALLVSDALPERERALLRLPGSGLRHGPSVGTRGYLAFHRSRIFKGPSSGTPDHRGREPGARAPRAPLGR
jgi:hypothetical protein